MPETRTGNQKFSNEEREGILMRVRANVPYKDIAALFNTNNEMISGVARYHGIYRRPYNKQDNRKRIRDLQEVIVAEARKHDRSYHEIAEGFDVCAKTVRVMAVKAGITRKPGVKFRTKHRKPLDNSCGPV